MSDFFSTYLKYVNIDRNESPVSYHRWTLVSAIGSLLGKNVHLPFGPMKIWPNQYIMLMGPPGARKGAAMNFGKRLLRDIGYNRFAKDKTSKERFLIDMKQYDNIQVMAENDIEAITLDAASESYIHAGEFLDFIGSGNQDFAIMLTNLWDCPEPTYEQPKIQGKSVVVEHPVVNLLGGATEQTFALAIPTESLETGFLSRMILVHSDPTGIKIAWPETPDPELGQVIKDHLKDIRRMAGKMSVSADARELATKLYGKELPVDDIRFKHYQQRRYTHMLKLSMIMAASELRYEITRQDVIRANTMLAVIEPMMGKALGEFGASRFAAANGKILAYLEGKMAPQNASDIWKRVSNDVHNLKDLSEILAGLKNAGKIQVLTMKGKTGYVRQHEETKAWPAEFLDLNWLTERERSFITGE